MKPRLILVVGAGGMLGQALMRQLGRRSAAPLGESVRGLSSSELNICDAARVREVISDLAPRVVINAAAYTDVDGCESNWGRALAVNGDGPRILAEACLSAEATLIHVSTDFVFDGNGLKPYRPYQPTHPVSAYGRSKLEGERGVVASGCRYLIVRTSWLFGSGGRNFVDTILTRARAGDPLRVVADQIGRPTYVEDLATAILRLMDSRSAGIVHFGNGGDCSWYEFANAIVREAGIQVEVQPITSDELSRPAMRPAYSVLDLSDYTAISGWVPPHWRDALRRYLAQGAAAQAENEPVVQRLSA